MSRLIEPGGATDTASECPDECSKLVVSTKSITSIESSFDMTDEQESGQAYVLRVLPPFNENKSCFGGMPLALGHPPKPRSDSLNLSGQPGNDESVVTSCVDADNRSTVYSDSLVDNSSQDKDTSASVFDSLASQLEKQVFVDGVIGSFHEYIRPNAPTTFLFSFTPTTGTETPDKQPCENALIGHLEKVRIEKEPSPPPLGQKSIKLRKRRGVDVRSLTFGDWRPGTDTEREDQSFQHSQDDQSHATRRTTASEPVAPNLGFQSDTKTTEDRKRFDFLVSRLQQKLSERSRGSCCGSTKEGSAASRQSSHAGSAPSNNGHFSENAASSSSNYTCVGSDSLAGNGPPRVIREGHIGNGIQGESQSRSDRSQCMPQPYSVPHTQTTSILPQQVFFPMMHQVQQFPPPWNAQNQGPGLGRTESATTFTKGYHPPVLQPHMVAWPPAPGVLPHVPPHIPPHVPIQFGGHQYTHHPQAITPGLPQPHDSPLLPATGIKHPLKPQRLPRKRPTLNENIPFIPLNATEQQKIEEHIEFLKATVPSFALVSRRRQRQRWLREKSSLETRKEQQRQHQTGGSKNGLQGYQPFPQQPALQPVAPWNPQLYHQLQQQYYQQILSSTAAPDVPRNDYQPSFNPMPLPGNLWFGWV